MLNIKRLYSRHNSCYIFQKNYVDRGLPLKDCIRAVVITVSIALLAGCAERAGPEDTTLPKTPLLTAATLGEQSVRTVIEYLDESPYATADQTNGARQAQVCRACHSLIAYLLNVTSASSTDNDS